MGYSGILGSFSLCNARKNNQWEDVDNQGGRWNKEKVGARVSEQINFHNKAIQMIIQFKIVFGYTKNNFCSI